MALQAKQTHCKRGHALAGGNVRINNGKRTCLACEHMRNQMGAVREKAARHARGLKRRATA